MDSVPFLSCLIAVEVESLSRVQLCDPTDCSTPGLPVHHQLPEFTQTHVHQVGDAIQPSHPLLSPSPPAFSLFSASGSFPVSQFFTSGGQSIGTSVLPMNIRTDLLSDGLLGSPCRSRDSQESSPTHQFKSINFSVLSFQSNSHIHT